MVVSIFLQIKGKSCRFKKILKTIKRYLGVLALDVQVTTIFPVEKSNVLYL